MATHYSTTPLPPSYGPSPPRQGSSSPKQARKQTPPHQPIYTGQHNDMFPRGQFRDLWAGILFYVHLAGMGVLAYFALQHVHLSKIIAPTPGDPNLKPFGLLALSAFTSALLSSLVLFAARMAPRGSIQAAYIANLCLSALAVIICLTKQNTTGAFLAGLFCVLTIFIFVAYQKHISLSAVILKTVVDVLADYPAMLFMSVSAALFQALYLLFVCAVMLGLLEMFKAELIDPSFLTIGTLYCAFSEFWTSQVIANITLTTVAGVYATFYFCTGAVGQRVVNPTLKSFGRVMTWSFGSVCFGSMIVAIIQTLRFMLSLREDKDDLLGAIVGCLMQILEDLVQYFNYYAYIHVAIYGKPYLKAAKQVWGLLKGNGVLAIINDNIIGTFCSMSSLAISALCGLINYFACSDLEQRSSITFFGWFMGMVVSVVVLEIIKSGSSTTMVCLAEDPEALKRTKPELYARLSAKYERLFQNWRYP